MKRRRQRIAAMQAQTRDGQDKKLMFSGCSRLRTKFG